MKIKILYEDKNILAIDKPSGILVHSDQKGGKETLQDIFLKKFPKLELVHRLDRETSGVILFAKNKKAHEFLKKQFMGRTIRKVYNAIVVGSVKNDHGVINKPIGRSPVDFRRRLAGRGARGTLREAITEYKVLKRFKASTLSKFLSLRPQAGPSGVKISKVSTPAKFTFLEIKPKTGRTHQIRVHMKYLNHPVACDSLYNPKGSCPIPPPNLPLAKGEERGRGITRLMLHAKSIEFKNLKGKTIKVESPLPREFKKYFKIL
mgnify:FL=1